MWGALVASARDARDLAEGAERRLCDVAELVAQALANADAREKLAASRARIVEAGDAERRRLERNLHDGAQQRLVALARPAAARHARLDERSAAARDAAAQRDAQSCARRCEELRELARGIHPAVLTERGSSRRSRRWPPARPCRSRSTAMPEERLPAPVEAAAYYIIAEALTNVAKYADASHVAVAVRRSDGDRTWSRSPTTASAAPTRPPARGCGASPTASRRWTAACRS